VRKTYFLINIFLYHVLQQFCNRRIHHVILIGVFMFNEKHLVLIDFHIIRFLT